MAGRGIDGYTIPPPELVGDGYDTDLLPYTDTRSPYLQIPGGPRPPPLGERPILSAYGQQEDATVNYYDDNPLVVGNPFLDDPWEAHPFVRRRPQGELPATYDPRPMESISVPFRQSDPYAMPFHPSNPSLVPEPLRVLSREKPPMPLPRRRSLTYNTTFNLDTYPERWEWEMHGRDVGDFYALPYENMRPATPPRRSGSSSSRRHRQGGSTDDRRSRKENSRFYPPKTSETRPRPRLLVETGIPKHLLPRRSRTRGEPVSRKSSHRRREHRSGGGSNSGGEHQRRDNHRHKHHRRRNTHHERRPDTSDDTPHHKLRPHSSSATLRDDRQQRGRETETHSLGSSSPSRWSFQREDGTSFFAPPLQATREAAAAVTKRGKSASFHIGNRLSGWRDRFAATLKKDESVESFACVMARAIERGENVPGMLPPRSR